MVEQKLSVRDEDLRKGNPEEADTVVARYLPKHRSLWGRHRHSNCQSCCSLVEFRLVWAISYFCLLSPSFSICMAPRPARPWCPLYVTYVAFSLYHTPLQDVSGFSLVAVNVLPPNPYFSTCILPLTIDMRLTLSWSPLHISLQHSFLTL